MPRFRTSLFAALLTLVAVPATAQEFTYGLGFADFRDNDGNDTGVFDLEYRHNPFFERNRFSLALGANASVTAQGDVFVGTGLWNRLQFGNGIFFETSFMPGVYEEGTSDNDLSSTILIRSQAALGYTFDDGRGISVAFSRKSNFGIAKDDPTQFTYSIRNRIPF